MMVTKWYYKLEEKFSDIQCDAFICMPDHIHFIIINNVVSSVGADPCVCPHIDKWGERTGVNEKNIGKWGERTGVNEKNIGKWGEHTGSPLHRVIQWFKTMSTNDYIKNVKINNWIPFDGKLWQRNYYEHIIRNQYALENIRRYIINNPMRMDKNRRSNRMSSGRLK
jgi:REP element-mobilizing transposase RayT